MVKEEPTEKDKLSPYQGKGFLISKTPDGAYSMTLSGRIQLGLTFLRANGETQFYPDLYSARLIFSGNILRPDIYYLLQIGFGEQERYFAPTPLLDAWIDFRQVREANLRFGTLDHHAVLHSSANNQLTMDALAHYEYDLFRDVGLRLHSEKPFGIDGLRYWFEVASGKGPHYLLQPNVLTLLYYGRVEVSPFGAFDSNRLGDLNREPKPRLSLAVSAAYNSNAIFQTSDWAPPGMTPYLKPFDYVHGHFNLNFKWRGFSLFAATLYRRATDVSHVAIGPNGDAVTEYSRNGIGWWTTMGMMLTAHLEVATRIGAIHQIDRPPELVATAPYQPEGFVQLDVANVRDLREVVGGMSYYFSGHSFKIQADYARIFVRDFEEGIHEVRSLLTAQL